jgi:hypothetical protein
MTARYTFAVCIRCGVQSPPMIVAKEGRVIVEYLKGLQRMGWRAWPRPICPACIDAEEKDSDSAA